MISVIRQSYDMCQMCKSKLKQSKMCGWQKSYSTIAFTWIALHLFVNVKLHTQWLEKMLRFRQLLPLERHLTLQPANSVSDQYGVHLHYQKEWEIKGMHRCIWYTASQTKWKGEEMWADSKLDSWFWVSAAFNCVSRTWSKRSHTIITACACMCVHEGAVKW